MSKIGGRLSAEAAKTLKVTRKFLEDPKLEVLPGEPYADLMPTVARVMELCWGDSMMAREKDDPEKAEVKSLIERPTKDEQKRMTIAMARYILAAEGGGDYSRAYAMRLSLAKVLDYTADELLTILAALERVIGPADQSGGELLNGVKQVEAFIRKQPITPEIMEMLQGLVKSKFVLDKHKVALRNVISAAENPAVPAAVVPAPKAAKPKSKPAKAAEAPVVYPRGQRELTNAIGEKTVWGAAFRAELDRMDDDAHAVWSNLVNLAAGVGDSSSPTKKWIAQAAAAVEAVGAPKFVARLKEWLPQFALGTTAHLWGQYYKEVVVYKGLILMAAPHGDRDLAATLADLALHCYLNSVDQGFLMKAGSGCLVALASMPNSIGIAQLTRLKARLKHKTGLKTLERALEQAAAAAGLTKDALEESQVPTGGMDRIGEGRRAFGDATLVYTIRDSSHLEQHWEDKTGKVLKSTPAALKADADLKAFQKELKELGKLVSAQRVRLESLMRRDIKWTFEWWKKHYIDHPVLGWLGRRLLWKFTDGGAVHLGIWDDSKLVDAQGRSLPAIAAGATVELFHPIDFDEDVTLAWRDWLIARQLVQPFKQVFREVYLLTPAEEVTHTYSNRFAAHIVGHNQLMGLAKERGWSMSPFGYWDGSGEVPPLLRLPDWNIVAEFLVTPATDEMAAPGGFTTYLATDQVRFLRDKRQLPLAQVPRRVFSEVMRDVDLFVGVASIGADPHWIEGGNLRPFGEYWQSFAFGDLTTAAESRRGLLEKLLPRLRIAPQCRLDGRYLVVKGSLRTYRIHIGSANILMEPNDRYLCIVPDRKGRDSYYLPFEGDTVLATVLSKAFLLADDAKIQDESIMRQIRTG